MKSDDLKVKILGIVGTPIKKGNCQFILEEALKVAEETGKVETELVHLQDYRIEYCIGCEGCLKRVHRVQKEVGFDVIPVPVKGYNCGIKDDMEILHEKMLEADGIILAAPVYIGTIPGQVKTFIDRCRTFVHDYRLRGKVAAPLTVAFYRNAGEDTTLQIMTLSLLAIGLSVTAIGASTVSTKEGMGALVRDNRYAVKEDTLGMTGVMSVGSQIAQAALQMKAGKIAMREAGLEIKSKGGFPELSK
ncbi:MAG: flavodoxin family protein [Candidatus Tectomicrobia bacterium]|uniref:Flavodoxin family protein n=1 Tax=Tectimicrobiota bacterium TaxID=2528274 RepID=A0A933GLN7_UNCTE|nr:flavodoxin family protein [Candidatus Tectomicrobia bacterium]